VDSRKKHTANGRGCFEKATLNMVLSILAKKHTQLKKKVKAREAFHTCAVSGVGGAICHLYGEMRVMHSLGMVQVNFCLHEHVCSLLPAGMFVNAITEVGVGDLYAGRSTSLELWEL